MTRAVRLVNMDGPPASAEAHATEEVAFFDRADTDSARIGALEAAVAGLQAEQLLRTRWIGEWVSGTAYEKSDQVTDGSWLAIANKATSDQPAPQPQGEENWAYQGLSPLGTINAKELIIAQRYQFAASNFINGWRSYEVAGNNYRAYIVRDPTGIAEVELLLVWTAAATGWKERSIIPQVWPAGTDFELALATTEPASVPVTWTGNWNYQTPNNETNPNFGNCSHANKALDLLKYNYIDDDGGDRTTELQAMLPGDNIVGAGMTWVIQVVTQNIGFITYTIAPAQQGAPDGVTSFSFETVVATDIETVIDPNYFASEAQISASYSIDNAAPVVTQDAYGIDILVQQAAVSEDWDIQSKQG